MGHSMVPPGSSTGYGVARYGPAPAGVWEETLTMRKRRSVTFAILLAAAGIFAVLTGPAVSAQQNGPSPGPEVLNTTISSPTALGPSCSNVDLTVTTEGLLPGSAATFTLYSDPVVLGTVAVGDDGIASLTFSLPAGTDVGTHRVETTGTDTLGEQASASVDLQVLSCATGPTPTSPGTGPGGNGSLARTGTDLGAPIRIGIVVLAAGAALVLTTRKRQARAA